VIAIGGIGIYLTFILVRGIYRLFKPETDDDDHSNKRFELASILLTGVFLVAASLEGVKGVYSFSRESSSSAAQLVSATKAQVWQALQTATEPTFPLPTVLSVFPQPVEVVVDEGTSLNAHRVVKFKGREGEGYLRLRVVERSQEHVRFRVLADSSPIANWVAHRSLTYRVEKRGLATRLVVVLEYDRLLAPAWFFNTLIGGATHIAMDVLARDVKNRAEQLASSRTLTSLVDEGRR